MIEEGVQADGDPGGDRPAQVLAGRGDRVEGGGRARGRRRWTARRTGRGADRVGDPVGADLLRVVVEDRHAAPDTGLEDDARGTSNHRLTMLRSSPVTVGTDELTAIAVTAAEMSRPSRSSNWVSITAYPSGVREGTVERRQ